LIWAAVIRKLFGKFRFNFWSFLLQNHSVTSQRKWYQKEKAKSRIFFFQSSNNLFKNYFFMNTHVRCIKCFGYECLKLEAALIGLRRITDTLTKQDTEIE